MDEEVTKTAVTAYKLGSGFATTEAITTLVLYNLAVAQWKLYRLDPDIAFLEILQRVLVAGMFVTAFVRGYVERNIELSHQLLVESEEKETP